MKKIISHRGNLVGPNPELENKPEYILSALDKNYDVEIDVWFVENKIYLGHDRPTYKVDIEFLKQKGLWCHAKNLEAFQYMIKNKIHCFWHESDKCVLTSKGFLWCFPGVFLKNGITVVDGKQELEHEKEILGVCTDHVLYYAESSRE